MGSSNGSSRLTVVGAGFAGVEAAWNAANAGVAVTVFEMRPSQMTPAHTTGYFAELVCSNSLKSNQDSSPAGQLKNEMRRLGSLILEVAAETSVPGGQALAVDRDKFGELITNRIRSHPNITVVEQEFQPDLIGEYLAQGPVILATGPLSSAPIANCLAEVTGRKHLYFYDAVSPTVEASSLNRDVIFAQSRYDKGEGDDYLNCPFNKEEYERFVVELVAAERAPIHAFEAGGNRSASGSETEANFVEKIQYFSGCQPIEAIAERGARSLAFGNFKPVGLVDPRTGRRPWAALQLRPENREKTLYSLVACQTRLKWGEQKRVFQLVPGLEQAEFVRFGVIHRNTYLDAPNVLNPQLQLRDLDGVFVAGQLTGVEGYVESAAMGILAGMHAVASLSGETLTNPPRSTAYGSLLAHLSDTTPRDFAPMNINWGIFPDPEVETRDKSVKRAAIIQNANDAFDQWMAEVGVEIS